MFTQDRLGPYFIGLKIIIFNFISSLIILKLQITSFIEHKLPRIFHIKTRLQISKLKLGHWYQSDWMDTTLEENGKKTK